MKLCLKILVIAIVAASTLPLMSCAAPASFSYQNVTVSLTVSFCSSCNGLTYLPAPYPQPIVVPMQQYQQLLPGTVVEAPQNGASQGACIELTAIVTNAPANVTWTLYPQAELGTPPVLLSGTNYPQTEPIANTGNPIAQSTNLTAIGSINSASGATNYYCIPPTPPVYTGAALQAAAAAPEPNGWILPTWTGLPQGYTEVVASVPTDPTNPNACANLNSSSCAYTTAVFQVVTLPGGVPTVELFPRTPSGASNVVLTISHSAPNNTYQFTGFAVGASACASSNPSATPPSPLCANGQLVNYTDNSIVWQIAPVSPSGTVAYCSAPAFSPQISNCPAVNSAAYGTISASGLYTAPSVLPPIEPVVITAVAHAASAQQASAYVDIN
jgi:hypothetical protein